MVYLWPFIYYGIGRRRWGNCKRNRFGIIKRIDNKSRSPYVANLKVDVSSVSSLQRATLEISAVKSFMMANLM